MKLYHFLNEANALDDIRNRHLKVSRLAELNDPFELLGVELSTKESRKLMRRIKEESSRQIGLLCFSEIWHNPVMWSHYADRHRGICLEFEVPHEATLPVEYVARRLPQPNQLTGEFLNRLARTKYAHWRYERERRVLVNMKNAPEGMFFRDFSSDLQLTGVIVGSECSTNRKQLSDALGLLAGEVNLIKARPAFKSFRVVRNKNKRLWA